MPAAHPTAMRFRRLLLTGAAGGLGRELRGRLKAYCDTLRVSDIAPLGSAAAGEELQVVALQDRDAMLALLQGVDAVVHLGGVSVEGPFEPILQANIIGMHHLYEAARRHGVKRIVYASSNHVTGFYFDRYGLETVSLRIGSSFPEPKDRRMLATWMSYDDLERLVVSSLTAPVVGHSIIYGMSDNSTTWWDNTLARHVGYRPQDSSDRFRAAVEARQGPLDMQDPVTLYQGGGFVTKGPYE
jgi:uronate dehydrogenase